MREEVEALHRSLDSEKQGSGAAAREHSVTVHELRDQMQVRVVIRPTWMSGLNMGGYA